MTPDTRVRSLITLLVMVLAASVNAVMELTDLYSTWAAWVIYIVIGIALVAALHWQGSARTGQLSGILALPFIGIAAAALLGG
jgi:hypothetical protein